MPEMKFEITNDTGLHARPATSVVNKAGKYQSEIQLTYNGKSINLKSIMGLMSLGISKGSEVVISAEGKDAEAALEGLTNLIQDEEIGKAL